MAPFVLQSDSLGFRGDELTHRGFSRLCLGTSFGNCYIGIIILDCLEKQNNFSPLRSHRDLKGDLVIKWRSQRSTGRGGEQVIL